VLDVNGSLSPPESETAPRKSNQFHRIFSLQQFPPSRSLDNIQQNTQSRLSSLLNPAASNCIRSAQTSSCVCAGPLDSAAQLQELGVATATRLLYVIALMGHRTFSSNRSFSFLLPSLLTIGIAKMTGIFPTMSIAIFTRPDDINAPKFLQRP
jgi:hypothetical protein